MNSERDKMRNPNLDNGDTLIVADIHAEPRSLREVLGRETSANTRISLGDVVGYGSDSQSAVELVRGFDLCIMGNHDRLALGRADPARFSNHARTTSPALSPEGRAVLRTFTPSRQIGEVLFFHGSPESDEEYLFNEVDIRRVLVDHPEPRVMFCGHLHIPRLARLSEDSDSLEFEEVDPTGSEHVLQLERYRYVVNVPSLSMGRMGYTGGYCVLGPLIGGARQLYFRMEADPSC